MASLSLVNNVKSLSNDGIRVFESLEPYLQPSSRVMASTIAEQINGLARKVSRDSESDIEGFLWEIWRTIISIAKQIPCDHLSQDRLTDVVRALVEIPPATIQIWQKDTYLWTDLPLLGPSMREAWIPPTTTQTTDDRAVAEWISLNAFAARLFTVDFISWIQFPVWALRSALEEETFDQELACGARAASEWIVRCGRDLFNYLATYPEDRDNRALRSGPLYNGPGGISIDRWQFWKKRFGEISASDEDLHEICTMAKNEMEYIEDTR